MGLLDFLGFGGPAKETHDTSSANTLREIMHSLEEMEPDRAKYIAAFAYMLGRVAHADMHISDDETREMERIIEGLAGIPEEQALLVVQIAKTQNKLFGATDNVSITQEFNRIASRAQKLALLNCLFAVSSSDQSISTAEDHEIRRISQELRLDHADFIAARSSYKEHLEVLKREK